MLTACDTDDASNKTDSKGGFTMTELTKQALILNGTDMDKFNADNPEVSETTLIESVEALENTLAKKYPGIDFEMTAYIPGGILEDYDEFSLQPVGKPAEAFTAEVHSDGKCTDSYYGVIKTAEYEALLSGKIAAAEPSNQVFSTINYQFDDAWDASAALEKAVSETGMYAYTWILLAPGDAAPADRAEAVKALLSEAGLKGDYAVYVMLDDALKLTKAEAFEKIPANSSAQVYSDIVRFIIP